MKKKLTQSEEFEILKLVLDKFLWFGLAIMGYGLYLFVSGATAEEFPKAIGALIVGALILVVFMIILLREYQVSR